MQDIQDRYFIIFFKNMLKNDEHPDGIPNLVRVFVIYFIFFFKIQNYGLMYLFREICRPSTYSPCFESRHTNLCGHVKDFKKAWPLPWYHNGLPITPLCASLASNNQFFKLPLSFVHVSCRSYA